ncbi:MAG: alpha-N-acetylglucosaminidase [Prevotellaceae bacterium]|jgi:alpha-N-acetylglucosaminidase|nr:alpha-N-acetylglucosaminidase [Prevotellaceae bacterium]
MMIENLSIVKHAPHAGRGLIIALCFLLWGCTTSPTPADALAQRITDSRFTPFVFRLKPIDNVTVDHPDAVDYFDIEQQGDKIAITGNNNISLATGLNWYLKYVAHIHISWNNLHQALPDTLPRLSEKIHRETRQPDRYYLNYCTFSYSMAFWDWQRWEQELDWMALHGINLSLAMTGIDTVWRNLLKRIGYTTDEINNFIAGPAYQAWWQMNNLEGWGGPNPDGWYNDREALQKKIVKRMRELGIRPVFPGYSGMVPRDIGEKLGYNIADPGKWCGFDRPAFLSPEDPRFAAFAAMYYEELEKLYGKADYYSMDPFHEGGNTQGVDLTKAGQAIASAMKKANPQAVWVVQAWQANPRPAMIDSLRKGDMVVLDLYSEKRPQWGDPHSPWYREKGFGKHNWLYCMLLNFGGNVGLHGRMNQLVNGYYDACHHPNGKTLRGVGATPEGIENNPVMYELLYELPWRPERFAVDDWMQAYLTARYGAEPTSEVQEAWRALEHTVYNAPVNYPGEGTVESLFCARPEFHLDRTSTWGAAKLFYDADSTAKAARLMTTAASRYAHSNNFDYDRIDIVRQSNADQANVLLQAISDSYDHKNLPTYRHLTTRFLSLLLQQDSLLASRPEFSLDTWMKQARSLGHTDADQQLYLRNAISLVTVWGDSIAANREGLHDYSHREWSGLLKGLYYRRWESFLKQRMAVLEGKEPEENIDFYDMERTFVRYLSSSLSSSMLR